MYSICDLSSYGESCANKTTICQLDESMYISNVTELLVPVQVPNDVEILENI